MLLRRSFHGGERGQAQILAAAILGSVMITGALFSMQRAVVYQASQAKTTMRSEMRQALDAAIERLATIYRTEAGCDPVVFNEKLQRSQVRNTESGDHIDLGVVNGNPPAQGGRAMAFRVAGTPYLVQIGPIVRLPWVAPAPMAQVTLPPGATVDNIDESERYLSGQSQDVQVEVWTGFGFSPPGQGSTPNLRVLKRAILVNTCTTPCSSSTAPNDPCPSLPLDRAVAYHRVVGVNLGQHPAPPATPDVGAPDPAIWGPGGLSGCGGQGGRRWGDLTHALTNPPQAGCPVDANTTNPRQLAPCVTPDHRIDVADLMVLRNYLRSGEAAGSTGSILAGTAASPSCADLNRDGLVDAQDLGILEKYLRGYLYWLPVQ